MKSPIDNVRPSRAAFYPKLEHLRSFEGPRARHTLVNVASPSKPSERRLNLILRAGLCQLVPAASCT